MDGQAGSRVPPPAESAEAAGSEYGDLLVRYLELLGVEYVFGVPGGAIEPLVDALARGQRRGGPTLVIARHETGAAFMAEGYHQTTGRLGVCFATTGPGATNLVTGVASAHANNIPILVITAQTALDNFGRGALQESSCTGTDTLSIFQSITRYNTLVSHYDQLEHKLAAAFMCAWREPRGPAHLSIPADVLRKPARKAPDYPVLNRLLGPSSLVDQAASEQFYQELIASSRPVFLIGSEAGGALHRIEAVADHLDIPLLATPHGKGVISPYHPLFRGIVGFAGHRSAMEVLEDPAVDLVVAIGASLGEWASNGWDRENLLNTRLVHVSPSDNYLLASPMARLHVRGSLEEVFGQLGARLSNHPRRTSGDKGILARSVENKQFHFALEDEEACRSDRTPLAPQRLMTELPRLFPAGTRYLADSGNALAWAIHYLHPPGGESARAAHADGGLFSASLDFASMGWAIGCAVGMALGRRGEPVVCITGDGSYLMAGQEITVAIQCRLPVIYLVLNDSAYGMVKHGQRLTGAEPVGFELPPVDFVQMAAAMGVPGYNIVSVADLQALDIEKICATPGPTLLDVKIDGEAIPPMELRTKILAG